MRASDLLVACLEQEGVEHVFGLPGEELEDLLFSLEASEVTFIPTRHEQGAAFMADVHGRLTGEAGVCLSTLGPGATNLVTGVADATLDKAPLVAITGQGGLERLHKESHQAINVVDMLAPISKWNTQISDPDIVHESVRKAFKVAEYEKPGSTHLEFPEDVAARETEKVALPDRERVRRPDPDPDSMEALENLLTTADRPLIIAGNGAVRTDAGGPLRELVTLTDYPVASTYMGKGAVSDADPHSLLTLDSGDDTDASAAIETADLIVTVGYDIAEHDPADWNPTAETSIVHIDSEPAEVYEHYNPDLEIVADIGATLRALSQRCERIDAGCDPEWYRDIRERIVADVMAEPDEDDPFTVASVLVYLRDAMADDDVLISDVGSHKMAIARNFPTYEPNTCLISNGLAAIGIAVPGGIAADLAVDANVVAATGDGGFLMNAAEIETATRLDCEYTILVFNDDDYGLISEKQEANTGRRFGTELTNPDFVTFAESFGIDGYRPTSWPEVRTVFEETIDSGRLSLVEVPLSA